MEQRVREGGSGNAEKDPHPLQLRFEFAFENTLARRPPCRNAHSSFRSERGAFFLATVQRIRGASPVRLDDDRRGSYADQLNRDRASIDQCTERRVALRVPVASPVKFPLKS